MADCRVLCFNFINNCITFFAVLVFLNTNLSIFFSKLFVKVYQNECSGDVRLSF